MRECCCIKWLCKFCAVFVARKLQDWLHHHHTSITSNVSNFATPTSSFSFNGRSRLRIVEKHLLFTLNFKSINSTSHVEAVVQIYRCFHRMIICAVEHILQIKLIFSLQRSQARLPLTRVSRCITELIFEEGARKQKSLQTSQTRNSRNPVHWRSKCAGSANHCCHFFLIAQLWWAERTGASWYWSLVCHYATKL